LAIFSPGAPGSTGISNITAPSPSSNDDEVPLFRNLRFKHPLRRYQTDILDLVNEKVARGQREIHVVAPPGAGKTIIGLQLVSNFSKPSLILSPNTTIQGQWSQKLNLFLPERTGSAADSIIDPAQIVGTHEDKPLKPLTVLTYQVLSTPGREQEYLAELAQKEWVNELKIGRGLSVGEAELRILELLQNNPKAHQKEMSRHMSRLRRRLTDVLRLEDVLHKNALALLQSLRRQGVGLVIFDECHHLTDYWAAIMTHLVKMLDDPIVIALTGTPPEGKTSGQENRYSALVGSIDYQVPTPALVREGGLAPFQDLVYFTEPTGKELQFLESQHEAFHLLVEELIGESRTIFSVTQPQSGMYQVIDRSGKVSELLTWILQRTISACGDEGFNNPMQVAGKSNSVRPALALAMLRCLWKYRLPFPRGIEFSTEITQHPVLDDWMQLLEDFASHKLKTDSNSKSHETFEKIKSAAYKLGYSVSERGLRRQASPVDRVLAFSKSKAKAVAEILAVEQRSLGTRLRAIVVTDFERMSPTGLKSVSDVLDEESGGAAGVLKALLATPVAALVNPCLVTGSLLLIDARITEAFELAAVAFLEREGIDIAIDITQFEGDAYSQVTAASSEWDSRLYVRLATELFERGITRCLIGTRGLFGEGWDSQALNTLIDLTTTTAPVSVKQLRGRSIRIQTNDPLGANKVANNWDVVCIAPQLEKGLNDYDRFVRKHQGFFGIADDGQIERGVGHVHPAFPDLNADQVFASSARFNNEMFGRALRREEIYDLWRVGDSYSNRTLECLELANLPAPRLTPPFLKFDMTYKQHAQWLRARLMGTWCDYALTGGLLSLASGLLAMQVAAALQLAPGFNRFGSEVNGASASGNTFAYDAFLASAVMIPFIITIIFAFKKYQKYLLRLASETCKPCDSETTLRNMSVALVSALKRTKQLPPTVTNANIVVRQRSNGCYRVFLENVDFEGSKLFVTALKELLSPISSETYVISRYEFSVLAPLSEEDNCDIGTRKIKEERQLRKIFGRYLWCRLKLGLSAYHAVPSVLARSAKGRAAFQQAWNKHVSPGKVVDIQENSDAISRYFGVTPRLARRLLWE
jgi:DNA or RNA helicases of superfamily II